MTTYQLTREGYVIRDGDTKIPIAESAIFPNENKDFLQYKSWLTDGNVPMPASQLSKDDADGIVAQKIEALWQSADKYTSGFISGVAIGLLAIGVMQQKPKSMAISEWSSRIWSEYYARKSMVTVDGIDNHDFSMFGPMPYTVPEMQAELGIGDFKGDA